ncbi:YbaK/EbsC family protein [Streptomyces sannanensis]|uniref:YbaK/EbsC family protein n=1 Tax=Streptomyces sannanensis TaxID=285536 RepID=A0ABP6SB39_9ACTN
MSSPDSSAHPLFAEALRELGLDVEVRRFPDSTRTAAEAAAAIGCELSRIAKSLIFSAWGSPLLEHSREQGGGVPVLVLMDGASRVDVELVRRELGAEKVKRADANLVRETTGYAIGGVPPFGHRTKTRVLADRGLLDHDVVWAAAGTPHAVFPLDPKTLIAHAGGILVDVRERNA